MPRANPLGAITELFGGSSDNTGNSGTDRAVPTKHPRRAPLRRCRLLDRLFDDRHHAEYRREPAGLGPDPTLRIADQNADP